MKNNIDKESDFVNKLVGTLQNYFKVQSEVWSDCNRGRIDLILTTKEGYRFGVECKRNDNKRGEQIGEFILQAIRYKDYLFGGVKIPIFIAPPLSYNYFLMNEISMVFEDDKWHKDRHKETHEHHSCNGFLGAFGIGEIRNLGSYFILSLSNKNIWSSKKDWKTKQATGTHIENYKKLIIKLEI